MKDKKLKEILKTMIIIIDSREHLPSHITETFDRYNIKWESKKVNSGDYMAYIPINEELGITEEVQSTTVIERKMSIEEICSNLIRNRDRFKREFNRKETDIIIMIEGNTYEDIVNNNYHNKVQPESFLASLHSISDEFKTPFIFISKKTAPLFIYNTLKYNLRNQLKEKE